MMRLFLALVLASLALPASAAKYGSMTALKLPINGDPRAEWHQTCAKFHATVPYASNLGTNQRMINSNFSLKNNLEDRDYLVEQNDFFLFCASGAQYRGCTTGTVGEVGVATDNQSDWSWSSRWRFGDPVYGHPGASVVAFWSPVLMANFDGCRDARWKKVMKGGAKIVLGSTRTVENSTERFVGSRGSALVWALNNGEAFSKAWLKTVTNPVYEQDATALATGRDRLDCTKRLNGIRWRDMTLNTWYPKLVDGNAAGVCNVYVNQ